MVAVCHFMIDHQHRISFSCIFQLRALDSPNIGLFYQGPSLTGCLNAIGMRPVHRRRKSRVPSALDKLSLVTTPGMGQRIT